MQSRKGTSDHDDIDSARSAAMRDSAGRFLWDLEENEGDSPSQARSTASPASPRASSRRAGLGTRNKRTQRRENRRNNNQGIEGLGLKYQDAAYSDEAEEYMGRPRHESASTASRAARHQATQAAYFGLLVAVGFCLATMLPGQVFLDRWTVFLIAGGSQTVMIVVITAILGGWRKKRT